MLYTYLLAASKQEVPGVSIDPCWPSGVLHSEANTAGIYLKRADDAPPPNVQECLKLAVKVLNKTMDGNASANEKMELFTMTLDENEKCVHHILTADEAQAVLDQGRG